MGLLHAARDRGTALALVLDRVPAGAVDEIVPHLRRCWPSAAWARRELLVVPETELEDGLLPAAALAPVRAWLDALAADAQARAAWSRGRSRARSRAGARARPGRGGRPGRAGGGGAATARGGRARLRRALDEVDEALRSGALLRGEVLARWHEVVGTGDFMRAWSRGRLGARPRARRS